MAPSSSCLPHAPHISPEPDPDPDADPVHCVQERNPRGYQYMLQLGSGAAFLGSSPEQLYARSGCHVASEAVAATRARGSPGA